MRNRMIAPLLLLFIACSDKKGEDSAPAGTDGTDGNADGDDGGTDGTDGTDGADGSDGTDGGEEIPVALEGFSVGSCDPDAPASSARLEASLSGADSISVRHDNLRTQCCAELSAEISVDGTSVFVYYTDAAASTPCDCECDFDLSYTLAPVEAGTWTISTAGSLSDTVIVP